MVRVVRGNPVFDDKKRFATEEAIKGMRSRSEEEQASTLAKRLGLPYADINITPLNAEDVRFLEESDAKHYMVGVFFRRGRKVRIGMVNPQNKESLDFLKKLEDQKGWKIQVYVISLSSYQKIMRMYHVGSLVSFIDQFDIKLTGENLDLFDKALADILRLRDRIHEIPTSEIVNVLFAGAIHLDASDIHFEPQEEGTRVRYRLDGILHDIGNLPAEAYKRVLSRIKILSKMKLNIRDVAQDGHFTISVQTISDQRVDVRSAIIPSKHGESIVLRLLNQSDVLLNVESLGLEGIALERLQSAISKTNGMIITTGPTGSGKTTTLYSVLNKLNRSDVKIITIENPIEYEIEGISQTQVNNSAGYTFSKGLSAIVRQDPDIILVGEVRDESTADVAINAALTGHLVLTTLHTNDAASSVPRLLELGVRPTLIPAAVNVFIAQRLVRKLCRYCREEYTPAADTARLLSEILAIISPKAGVEVPKEITKLYRSVGCKHCNGIGYKGRIGVFEIMTISKNIHKMIEELANINELNRAALEEGMLTMTQDGILKAVAGVTSIEEVWRISGQVDFLEEIYNQLMEQTLGRALLLPSEILHNIVETANTKEKFAELLKNTKLENYASVIMAGAVFFRAGDVHIEPEEQGVQIRFRIDGFLQTVGRLKFSDYPHLLGKIKMLSGLKSEVRGGVVDSRFALKLEEVFDPFTVDAIDIRVSLILGGYGETVVLRLLDKGAVALQLNTLGIRKENLAKLVRQIEKPNGIILNTGPTGSGKSTTLYSLLDRLNTPEAKIMTVEDPIEYRMPGLLQTQVDEGVGYTFSSALRSLLRQNPNVIMVGEVRDEETAMISIQAALTGHLVLTTLHTNDAVGSIQRLLNMGIRPEDLSTAVNAFMAQRLVRTLCTCKKEDDPTPEEKQVIDETLATLSPKAGITAPESYKVYRPVGCDVCHGIGYKFMTTVTEVAEMDMDIEELVYERALASKIKSKAIENGMITMEHDGVLKVIEGVTSLEEVKRVTQL